jgi:predicted DNA-binding protein
VQLRPSKQLYLQVQLTGIEPMSDAAPKRIAAIREKVREERARLSELNKQIGTDLKKQMKPASHYLDDVEGFFLAPEVLRRLSESEWARWLRNAETVLRRAVVHRKWVEGLIKKYGPDARTFG